MAELTKAQRLALGVLAGGHVTHDGSRRYKRLDVDRHRFAYVSAVTVNVLVRYGLAEFIRHDEVDITPDGRARLAGEA